MRLNLMILLLAIAALLLAESQPGVPVQRIEVRTSNSLVEITGSDSGRLQVDEASHASVTSSGGRMVVEGDGEPLRLEVPRRSSLEISTSNGAIHVSGVAGVMRLTTSNGAITVQNAGGAEIYAHTSNGSIEIGVPAALNATLSARTSNGQIRSDVNVVTDHMGPNFLEGKIGRGGSEIDLQTSNGSIWLRNDKQAESVNSTFRPGEVR